MTKTYALEGMHCGSCVKRVGDALRAIPSVSGAEVTLSPQHAVIESAEPVPLPELQSAVAGAGKYAVSEIKSAAPALVSAPEKKPSLYPLILIVGYIAGVVGLAAFMRGALDMRMLMTDFMAGFFLVFSFFKLLDLRGFADAYQMYDVIGAKLRVWAFAYPFVELALGVAFLIRFQPVATNIATLALMLIGAAGVFRALSRKQSIRCACLGTALNLPMTTVTLIEDLVMASMAGAMLLGMS
ncbi:hypothetical protein BH09SUM1_BH09SUM1_29780 [soil metagenome]